MRYVIVRSNFGGPWKFHSVSVRVAGKWQPGYEREEAEAYLRHMARIDNSRSGATFGMVPISVCQENFCSSCVPENVLVETLNTK